MELQNINNSDSLIDIQFGQINIAQQQDDINSKNQQILQNNTEQQYSEANSIEKINQKEIKIEERNLKEIEELEDEFFENNLQINDYTAHKIPLEELKRHLKTDFEYGLTNKRVQNKLKQQGKNKISYNIQKQSAIISFVKELLNKCYLYYWIGCIGLFIIYGLNPKDVYNLYLAILVLSSIFINGFLIFLQKQKKEQSIHQISQQLHRKSKVIREGKIVKIKEEELVEGDIIYIREGQVFPADIRVIEYQDLIVDQSSLTGEAMPVQKTNQQNQDNNYFESENILFQQCYCTQGWAKGVVIKTGNRTSIGSIVMLLSDEESDSEQFNDIKEISLFSFLAFLIGVLFFLISYFSRNLTIYQSISISISIILSISPISLLLTLYTSENILIQNLKEKQNILFKRSKNHLNNLGDNLCIFLQIDTLTQNVWQVKNIWYGGKDQSNYDINNQNFQTLLSCLIITNTANFDINFDEDINHINYQNCNAEGSAQDIGQLRFLQSLLNVEDYKKRVQFAYQHNGQKACQRRYNDRNFYICIVEEEAQNSYYSIVIKGQFKKMIQYCSKVLIGNKTVNLDLEMLYKIDQDYYKYSKNCDVVIGFAKLQLSKQLFPRGSSINLSDFQSPQLPKNFIFCGMISQENLIIDNISQVCQNIKATNVKLIPIISEINQKTLDLLLKSGLIDGVVTNLELQSQGMSRKESINQCEGLIVAEQILNDLSKELIDKKKICIFQGLNTQIRHLMKELGYKTLYVSSQLSNRYEFLYSDQNVFYGDTINQTFLNRGDIFLNDNKLDQLIPLIEEGRNQVDNVQIAFGLYLSSAMAKILSFFAFVILDIPLPLSSVYIYLIFFILDFFISPLYESPEIDLTVRLPKKKERRLISLKQYVISFILFGFVSASAGFIGYFTTLNYYGFPIKSIFRINSLQGYKPPIGDFNTHFNPYSNQQESFFNENLYKQSFDCTTSKIEELKFKMNWLNDENQSFDLRKVFLKCNDKNKLWESSISQSYCNVDSQENKSPITNESICYSTEALKYAQTSFFVSIMFLYWIKIVFCSTKSQFFFTQEINKKAIQIIFIQLFIVILFLYVPGVQEAFGTRPIQFWLFGIPSFNLIILYALLEELRKYLLRNYVWFNKYLRY